MRGGDFVEENGVWRTIGGRRVFIKEGQSLSEAMKESGKFSKNKNEKEIIDEDKIIKKDIDKTMEEIDELINEKSKIWDKNLNEWNKYTETETETDPNRIFYAEEHRQWLKKNFLNMIN